MMAGSRIFLRGIRAPGRHGASPGERDAPQEFVIDLEVTVDLGEDDELGDTIDYRVIVGTVRDIVGGSSFVLVETLAGAVARAVFGLPRVAGVVAVVHKPAAAQRLAVDDVAVEAIVR
jgi:dihydroneopterin aldolase